MSVELEEAQLRDVLEGGPLEGHVRADVQPGGVLAVHDEGDGLLALYLTPSLPLAALAVDLGITSLVDVTPGPGPARALSLAELMVRSQPCELLHAPDALPERTTLMAAPHRALAPGRRLALTVQDPFHAVLYTREQEVLRAAVRAWLVSRIDATLGPDAPEVEARHLDPLLEPLADGSWRQLGVLPHQGYYELHFTTVEVLADGRPVVGPPSRWAGSPGGTWRAGWSW